MHQITKFLLKKREITRSLPILLGILGLMCLNACATAQVQFGSIDAPPSTNKLRAAILPVSGPPPGSQLNNRALWGRPHAEWSREVSWAIHRTLLNTGFYEVVSEDEVAAVIGEKEFTSWQWQKDDLALVRRVGKALHADYVIMPIRNGGHDMRAYESQLVCVNIASGRQFSHSYASMLSMGGSPLEAMADAQQEFKDNYQKLFSLVKEDLLATALRKASNRPMASVAHQPPPRPRRPEPAPIGLPPKTIDSSAGKIPEKSVPMEVKTSPRQAKQPEGVIIGERRPANRPGTALPAPIGKGREIAAEKSRPEGLATGRKRLVVYDFETEERFKVVALILTDALREELFLLGRHTLITRENILQVMQEYKLQQSGMVDEKQAVQLGKWLAANESITGRLALMGDTYIIQAKLTDVTTLETLGMGSLRSPGKEGDLLTRIPELARRLVDRQRNAP